VRSAGSISTRQQQRCASTHCSPVLTPPPTPHNPQVTVDRPDVQGRVAILKVHGRGKSLGKDVDLDKVARRTPGFTGADLQNLMNEAAILAARRGLQEISKEEIADALERIIAGPEKKGAVMSDKKRRLVAYHEAGHALVGALMPEYDPVTKISIVPRGAAGGLTFFAPSEERLESGLYSRTYFENQMAVALGGRVAEELIFGEDDITTGASGDFQQVTRTARLMVTQLGFSDRLGQIAWSSGGGSAFLGASAAQPSDFSSQVRGVGWWGVAAWWDGEGGIDLIGRLATRWLTHHTHQPTRAAATPTRCPPDCRRDRPGG
jgi:cell division protease FtsH